jgi:hypothetical protein
MIPTLGDCTCVMKEPRCIEPCGGTNQWGVLHAVPTLYILKGGVALEWAGRAGKGEAATGHVILLCRSQ